MYRVYVGCMGVSRSEGIIEDEMVLEKKCVEGYREFGLPCLLDTWSGSIHPVAAYQEGDKM